MSDTSSHQEAAVTREDGTAIMEEADAILSRGTALNEALGNIASDGVQPAGDTITSNNINQSFPSLESQIQEQPRLGPNVAALPCNMNGITPTIGQDTQQLPPSGSQAHVQPVPSNVTHPTSNSHQGAGLSGTLPGDVPFEDGFASDAELSDAGSETDPLDENNKRRRDLSKDQEIAIVHTIAEIPSEDITRATRMIHEAVPEGYGLSLSDFEIIVHPDKWVADKDNNPKAEKAFKGMSPS